MADFKNFITVPGIKLVNLWLKPTTSPQTKSWSRGNGGKQAAVQIYTNDQTMNVHDRFCFVFTAFPIKISVGTL